MVIPPMPQLALCCEQMKAVMIGRLPDGVAVLAGGCTCQKPFDFLEWAAWAAPKNGIPLRQKDRDRSYKIGLSFRDLVFAVVYYPSTEYCYGVIDHQYVSLWGGNRRIIPIDRVIEAPSVA